jgi:hypothetical protein
MRGNGSACRRAKRTEVPVAVPRTQVRAKVELSRKEQQAQQKGGDSDFVAGAKHAYSHCRPKISLLVHQQNEFVPRRTPTFSPNQTSRFLRILGYTSREQRQCRGRKTASCPNSDRANLLFLRYERLGFRKLRPVRPATLLLRVRGMQFFGLLDFVVALFRLFSSGNSHSW